MKTVDRFQASKPAAVRQIGFLLIVGGIIVIVVSFLGCCGAAKEWRPLLCCVSFVLLTGMRSELGMDQKQALVDVRSFSGV